ncbi:alpha/beta hydrolase [Hydrogenophaga sp. 5NK40-0174]|uniref:alpha/beta hydrolase n=1 Tax=Hydrogenophaga sp. 5NK40-0174 TaxID=3127649 RepID=UPI0033405D67
MKHTRDKASQAAWLTAQYNNRALVPEHGKHLARWASQSSKARAGSGVLADLAYGHAQGESLDVFKPAPGSVQGLAPVMVFIHGGYWRSLDKSDHSFVAPAFTRQGVCVVVVNYALCPDVRVSDICMQMTQALAWVNRHIAVHGGDPSRVTVVGHSAGAHLAAMMLACDWSSVASGLPEVVVRNALGISGVYDLEPLRHAPFIQNDLQLTAAEARRVSPAGMGSPAHLPQDAVLMTVAGADESEEFRRQNGLMQAAWGEERVPVNELIKGRNHFSVLEELVRGKSRLHRLACDLLGV